MGSITDISIGYAVDIIVDYVGSGVVDNLGPSYGLATTNLVFSDNSGPSYALDASSIQASLSGFIGNKLIHYNVESEVQGKIIFGNKLPIIPIPGQIVEARGYGLLSIDIVTDTTIPASEVNALYTNSGAGGLVTATLPMVSAASGGMIDFVRTSANAFRIAASGTDRIVLPTGDAGIIELTSIGTQIKLISNGITSWLSI